MIGGGTVALTDFQMTCKLSIHFKKIEPGMTTGGDGDGGTTTFGCKNVGSYTANAQPPLVQRCAGAQCHGGSNGTATNAWDLRDADDTTATGQTNACGQTKQKINLANPASSILFQRVAPGQQTGHPITIADNAQFTAFRDAILVWVATEQ
jgi:hypothetical protein